MSTNKEFTFRARRLESETATLLETYGERDIKQFYRYNLPKMHDHHPDLVEANYDFGPMIEDAARLNEKIDMFDSNPALLDQVIFGVQFPALCHPGVADFVDDRKLIALLLVRHFKNHGGLVLPPLDDAQPLSEEHAERLTRHMAAGGRYVPMHYPNWRQTHTVAAPTDPVQPARGTAGTLGLGTGNVGAIGDHRARLRNGGN
ncbi:hypothetical protein HBI56_008880 [Parastagonospora nodorum]|nr:hypothetical protein HBH53_077560 [Parastagonospora nodorum]KAH4001196.1 hypothetical protein HBI10_096450 [Parastagonospora nodorum]KAH4033333.1 hypothetical protein HBI13_009300 [Parastagonospora nodorum]KAH4042141.1 hypothetical protein HBI09_009240 [Parastagonospora nodorum]KAH4060695.1 hypothetical protein HBH49_005400 [Parastagonospora nodorum]